MLQLTLTATSHRRRTGSWRESVRLLCVLAAVVLLGGCLSYVVLTTVASTPAGRAGSAPAAANWFYDIGSGYETGEIEQTTNSTRNVYLDGHGHLVLKATLSGGTWRSARIDGDLRALQGLRAGRVQAAGRYRRTVRHTLARQRPPVPARRQIRELLHQVRGGTWRQGRYHRPDLWLRGTLSGNPPLCAALNRHVAQLPVSGQSNPGNFYQAGPANYYAAFWHRNAINGKQYGFPYDDDANQSSDISVAHPEYRIVAVGW